MGHPAFDPNLPSTLQVLLLSTWSIILTNDPTSLAWFPFHPTLNSLAVLCFTYGALDSLTLPSLSSYSYTGILTLQPTSQPKAKAAGLQRHQTAMLIGLPSILLGTSAMVYHKGSHDAPHFTSWHGVRA
jgi:cytochrome b-561 domain containing protein 2